MNELKIIVKEIQYKTGETLQQIADRMEYDRAYLNDQINKGKNEIIKEKLIRVYQKELTDFLSRTGNEELIMKESETKYGLASDDRIIDIMASEQRTIEMLARQVEKMQNKITILEGGSVNNGNSKH